MADAKPFWSALYRSLTLTDRQDYEYRSGSIYKNISAIYRIKDDGQNIKVNESCSINNSTGQNGQIIVTIL